MPWHNSFLSKLLSDAEEALLALIPKEVELLGCKPVVVRSMTAPPPFRAMPRARHGVRGTS
jgi:hypothetical protein